MEEKLFKLWNRILSASDMEIRPSVSSISLRSKEICTTSLYVIEETSLFEETKIKLEFGFGGAKLVGVITNQFEYYDQAMETLERTKVKRDLESQKQLEIDRRKYVEELNAAIGISDEVVLLKKAF